LFSFSHSLLRSIAAKSDRRFRSSPLSPCLSLPLFPITSQLNEKMADQLTDIVTDAVLYIRKPEEPIDLHMVGVRNRV